MPAALEKYQCGVDVDATATNPFTHCPGRTIYNGGSATFQREMPTNPALLAIHDLIAEYRLKQEQWLEFVTREGPMHWGHPDSFLQIIWTSSVPNSTPFATDAVSPALDFSATASLEGDNMGQAVELDWAFEAYIDFE